MHSVRNYRIPFYIALLVASGAVASSGNAQNLVVNGDFSDGNTGFLYSYNYVQPAANALVQEGVFTITHNPDFPFSLNNHGIGLCSYFDHTCGDTRGSFLVVNGAKDENRVVWGQRIAVEPNTNYYFSTWVSTWTRHEINPARLQFRINGELIGPVFVASKTPGVWGVFEARWNSGNVKLADIYIVNQNTAWDGNDFGLDDIVFQTTSLPVLQGQVLKKLFIPSNVKKPAPIVGAP